MYILGISAFYHDSAAALIKDGEIISAAQEERFTRIKHDHSFPAKAIEYCLSQANITPADLDYVAFYDKPFLKFERLLESYLQYAPAGLPSFIKAMPVWIKKKIWIKTIIADNLKGFDKEILFPEHHRSHGASAFYPSPYKEAAVLCVDGVGEWASTSISHGLDNKLEIKKEIHFPHSLGMLYSAFTYHTGFKVNSGEYKIMGLAPYGEPVYVQKILDHLIDVKDDGSFRLNMKYFNYVAGLTMTNRHFSKLFGKRREKESRLTQREMDMARSVQEVTEIVMLKLARHAKELLKTDNLCLAGGVALNCVANGKIIKEGIFKNVWIQPAAGDAGGALGAALAVWYDYQNNERTATSSNDFQKGSYLGTDYSNDYIQDFLEQNKIPYKRFSDKELYPKVAKLLADENVLGWFQGKMEFGPRALGARSIIGDARSESMQKKMNLKIKYRESFRPFAPAVLHDKASEYFNIDCTSPYMLLVTDVNKEKQKAMSAEEEKLFGIDKLNITRSTIPAVTHVDYSARIQTVHEETNPYFYNLLNEFHSLTDCPVLINTSFNVRGEPIVENPLDAYKCFMRTEMDYLVLGNLVLAKVDQPEFLDDIDWQQEFELD